MSVYVQAASIEGYFAMRIIDGALDYVNVIIKYPELKAGIDAELILRGRQDLIVE